MVDSSSNCNEGALKIEFNIGPVICNVVASPSTSGCAPLTVNFTNLSTNGLTYLWDFGDGSGTVTTFSTSHTFTSAGVYTVTLSSANSNACFKTEDTFRLLIVVDTGKITPGFTTKLVDSCNPYIASFTNTSTDFIGTPTYTWYLGDGTTYVGTTPPNHTYADTGWYTVTLVMADTAACKSPDTMIHSIHFANVNVSAKFTIPDSLCLGAPFTPMVSFTNVTNTVWTFGDGTSSTDMDPSHIYKAVGSYTVTLIAQNVGACNGGDTLVEIIKILPIPVANFSYAPTTPVPNIPSTFTNLSTNAIRYLWDFGDNTTGTEKDPVHQYEKTGTYKVCLTAYNTSSCPSTVCKQAPADVMPLLGLPTGFSPNGDGENDVLYVRCAAIKTLDLKIYNRWGQLVFETRDQKIGWDGKFNGQPQPVEAYAYVLDATFIDGTSKVLKGNITLLR
jgi:gliding motility-associated-like protein